MIFAFPFYVLLFFEVYFIESVELKCIFHIFHEYFMSEYKSVRYLDDGCSDAVFIISILCRATQENRLFHTLYKSFHLIKFMEL